MAFITFAPITTIASDATGAARRQLCTLGSPEAIDALPESSWGRARRKLRTAGVPQAGYAGDPLPDAPDAPVIGNAQRILSASGTAFSAGWAGGQLARRLRTRGFAGLDASLAGGVTARTLRARAAVPYDGGLFIPDSPFVEGFANRAFETHMAFAEADDTLRTTPVLLLAANALAAVSPQVRARMRLNIAANALAGARLALWFLEQLADAAKAEGTAADRARYVNRLVDSLLANGTAATYVDAVQQIAAAVIATSEASAFALAAAQDGAVAVDTVVEQLRVVADLLDEALADAELTSTQRMTVVLADAFVGAAELDTQLDAYQLLQQGATAAVTLLLDSGVHVAWTYNMQSAGVTRYDNYPFNSFARIGDEYYGLTSTGLYRLGGDTDAGAAIKAKIRLGMTDMGTRKMKRLPEVFMGYTGDGRMVLRVIYVDDKTGEKVGADYLMKPRPAGSKRESRFEPGKGLVAVDFDFELENIDGADFALTNIEFSPMVVDRRTRG